MNALARTLRGAALPRPRAGRARGPGRRAPARGRTRWARRCAELRRGPRRARDRAARGRRRLDARDRSRRRGRRAPPAGPPAHAAADARAGRDAGDRRLPAAGLAARGRAHPRRGLRVRRRDAGRARPDRGGGPLAVRRRPLPHDAAVPQAVRPALARRAARPRAVGPEPGGAGARCATACCARARRAPGRPPPAATERRSQRTTSTSDFARWTTFELTRPEQQPLERVAPPAAHHDEVGVVRAPSTIAAARDRRRPRRPRPRSPRSARNAVGRPRGSGAGARTSERVLVGAASRRSRGSSSGLDRAHHAAPRRRASARSAAPLERPPRMIGHRRSPTDDLHVASPPVSLSDGRILNRRLYVAPARALAGSVRGRELAARRVDVAAARQPHGRAQPAAPRARRGTRRCGRATSPRSVEPVGLYGIRLTL